jgi:arylformamidase
MHRIYDISVTVTAHMPVWPGDPPVELERVVKMEDGEDANVSRLRMSAHAGTHVDAPIHFVAGGSAIEELPIEALVGPAVVIGVPKEVGIIDVAVLQQAGLQPGVKRVLFKTRNSELWIRQQREFQEDFVAVAPDGAEWLVQHGVRLVGIDYLSVAPFTDPVPTHRILLQAGVVALEGIDLSHVEPGSYTLYCLPLKLGGSDGAPARAILVSDRE